MADLNFDDLRLFARVAALGTLSAVARERNVPVSQVSRGLQRIEATYGTQLVRRTTHGMSLTPEGELLQSYAWRILGELDALDAEFGEARDNISGLVRVGMSAVIAQHLQSRGTPRSIADLSAHDLIANSQHNHLNVWMFKSGATVHASGPFSADHTGTVASMAIAGLGIARITSVAANPLVAQGKLVRVLPSELDDAPVPLSAFMLAGRYRLPKIRACVDHWSLWLQNTSPTC